MHKTEQAELAVLLSEFHASNDRKLVMGEIAGLGVCLCILFLMSAVYYMVYRYTIRKMCIELQI